MKRSFIKGIVSTMLAVSMAGLLVTGCGKDSKDQSQSGNQSESVTSAESSESESGSSTQVAEKGTPLTKVDPSEIGVTIGDVKVPAPEVFYYYYLMKHGMESEGGLKNWGEELSVGYTYADYLKQLVEVQVSTFEYLYSMVDQYGVKLTDEEKAEADSQVKSFLDTVSKEEKEAYGFNEETIRAIYDKTLLNNKVFAKLQEETEKELTDEDRKACKYKKIQHILITTQNKQAESGEDAKDADKFKADQKKVAEDVLKKVKSGEDFEAVAKKYTADGGITYYLNEKGQTPEGAQMVDAFYKAANELKAGEISGLVETQFGYHIIKCVNDNDESANKAALEQLVTQKLQDKYAEWSKEHKAVFSDVWKNYVVINPDVAPETETEKES